MLKRVGASRRAVRSRNKAFWPQLLPGRLVSYWPLARFRWKDTFTRKKTCDKTRGGCHWSSEVFIVIMAFIHAHAPVVPATASSGG